MATRADHTLQRQTSAGSRTATVLLCRHGETEWNSDRKFQGTIDIPLNDVGREQADRLSETLSSRGLAAVWTSPLIRAHSTAKRIADTCHVALRLDDRLRERNLGVMQGMKYRDVAKQHPQVWSAWKNFQPLPKDADAESDEEVIARLRSGILDIATQYPGAKVAIVGHGASFRSLLKESGSVGNASITTLLVGRNDFRVVGVDNEEHLAKQALKLGDLSNPDLPRPIEGHHVTTIMICRHGESEGNQNRMFQGRSKDLPLSHRGRMQSYHLGQVLKRLDVAALWTSPMARAHASAMDISAVTGLPVKVDQRLIERDLGKLEGVRFDDVKTMWPDAWMAWRQYLPLPEHVGAESREAVKERLEAAFFELASTYPGKIVAVVIHGANGRCLLKRSIGNGSITTVQVGPGSTWHVRKLGDASHLPLELAVDALKASKL